LNKLPNNSRRVSCVSGEDNEFNIKIQLENSVQGIDSNNKNKSTKGHRYRKSQTLYNQDNNQNKKNYLEENIYEIIQNIEKTENN